MTRDAAVMRSLVVALAMLPACSLIDAITGEGTTGPNTGYQKSNLAAGGMMVRSVAIGDLLGTGRLDVAMIDSTGALLICHQSDSGSSINFDIRVPLGGGYTHVLIDSLDGDPVGEVIAAGPGKLDVWRHAGGGNYQLHAPSPTVPPDAIPTRIAVGTLPLGSGRSVAMVTTNKQQVELFTSLLATPASTMLLLSMPTGPAGRALAIGDVHGTAGDELLVSDGMNLLECSGANLMSCKPTPVGTEARVFAIGEYGGSIEHDDLAYYAPRGVDSELVVSRGSPSGLVGAGMSLGKVGGIELVAGDFDGDDDDERDNDDIAFLDTEGPQGQRISLFLSEDEGETFQRTEISLDASPKRIAAGDLNGDGITDFALVPAAVGGVDLLLSR